LAMTIEEATYCSEKGYIDRADDIGEIMEHLTVLPLKELTSSCSSSYSGIFDIGLDMFDIPKNYGNVITYAEMLCVIDSIKFDYWTGTGSDMDAASRMCYVQTMGEALLKASRVSPWVKLYLSTSVKAYLDFIEAQAGTYDGGRRFAELKNMAYNAFEFKLTGSTTIEDLIRASVKAIMRRWNPLGDIDEYKSKIYAAHEVLDVMLMSSIKTSQRTKFSLAQIRRNAIAFERANCTPNADLRQNQYNRY